MFAVRICQSSLTPLARLSGAAKPSIRANNGLKVKWQQPPSRQANTHSRHLERRRTLKETAQAPTSGAPFAVGQGAVAGAAALGLGALCFYGLGLSNGVGAVDKQVLWPAHVKERIRATYGYFGASIAATAATAVGVFRTPALMNLAMRQGWVAIGVSIAAMIGSGILVRSIPYENSVPKHLAWLAHTGVMGLMVAPVCLMGGAVLTRAAWYTAGMVGGLSTVAACAPSDKFLTMGGPLAMGLGVVFVSSLGSAFLPPTTMLGAGLHSMALYGGLILFGGFMLYDTQKILHRAEHHPVGGGYGVKAYDPINASISIYIDTINIFIRMAQILGMGGNRRK